jgi:hypothetical protein
VDQFRVVQPLLGAELLALPLAQAALPQLLEPATSLEAVAGVVLVVLLELAVVLEARPLGMQEEALVALHLAQQALQFQDVGATPPTCTQTFCLEAALLLELHTFPPQPYIQALVVVLLFTSETQPRKAQLVGLEQAAAPSFRGARSI